tara:strand:- start:11537 stop:12592 length:1056 start_codon:yes stop_codon:yes gene_type:complete
MKSIKINNTTISSTNPCYIIAEAGVNHNGSLDLAIDLVRKAKEIGANCVKFQTFKAESVITKKAPKAKYQLEVTDPGESQFEMLKKLELSYDDYFSIIEECKKRNITFLSTPYNEEDADFLDKLGVSAFKIASGQIVELSFLKHVAMFNKPMIISSGMSTLAEVYEAIMAIRSTGNNQIALLQCTTNYPSNIEDANIRAMVSMGNSLDLVYGYSDHIEENYACYAAVSLGAKIIEKHFTLDRTLPGPDHKASLNAQQFQILIEGIRKIEIALGSPVKAPTEKELGNIEGMRRSIVLNRNVKKGEVITKDNLAFKRPATGLSPKRIGDVIGKMAFIDIERDTPLKEKMIIWD